MNRNSNIAATNINRSRVGTCRRGKLNATRVYDDETDESGRRWRGRSPGEWRRGWGDQYPTNLPTNTHTHICSRASVY